MPKATLVVRRDADEDIKMRNLEVHLDGEWRADVTYGKAFEAEIEPGEHEVMVTNRMKKVASTFVAREGETVVYQGTNVLAKGLSVVTAAFGVVAYNPTLKRIE